MFPCFGGIRYWPLTATVGCFRAPVDKVVRSAMPWKGGRGSSWTTAHHGSVDEALAAHAPFPYGIGRAVLAIGTRDGAWTVVVDTAFPSGDVVGFHKARALHEVRCEFVGAAWVPRSADILANAMFVHYLPQRRLFGAEAPPGDTRWIQASDQDTRWEFDASGGQRPFEKPDAYTARRKADRLPLALLRGYLAGVGVPVDDDAWLAGPVVAAVRSAPQPAPAGWSTVAELRKLCGYPDDAVPEDLVRWS